MRPAGAAGAEQGGSGPTTGHAPAKPAAPSAPSSAREVRGPPVRDVAVELGARKEAPQRLVLEAGHDDRLRLDDRQLARSPRRRGAARSAAPPCGRARRGRARRPTGRAREVAGHEVRHDRLDLAAERLAREVEAALAGQRRRDARTRSRGRAAARRPPPCSAASRPAGRASPSTTCSGRATATRAAPRRSAAKAKKPSQPPMSSTDLPRRSGSAIASSSRSQRVRALVAGRHDAVAEVDRVPPERHRVDLLLQPASLSAGGRRHSRSERQLAGELGKPRGLRSRSETSSAMSSGQAIADVGVGVVKAALDGARRSTSSTCRSRRRRRTARRSRARSRPGCRAGARARRRARRPSHWPYVGEARRRSTTTSRIRPRAQRTSLACPAPIEKCMPRRTPRAEREWLSCTNVSRDAVLRPDVGAVALQEEAAPVAVDGRLEQERAVEAGVQPAHRAQSSGAGVGRARPSIEPAALEGVVARLLRAVVGRSARRSMTGRRRRWAARRRDGPSRARRCSSPARATAEGARDPARLGGLRDVEVELAVQRRSAMVNSDRNSLMRFVQRRRPSVALDLLVEAAEVGEVDEPLGDGGLRRSGGCEARTGCGRSSSSRGGRPFGQLHRAHPVARADLAGDVRVAADDDVRAPLRP